MKTNTKNSPIWIYIILAINVVLLFFFVSFLKREFFPSTQNISGNVVLDWADQYREISSLMIQRNLEGDYDSLHNLLYESKNIIENVETLSVSPQYSDAKDLLLNWMYSDSLYYLKSLQNPSDTELESIFEMSSDYYLSFLQEMNRLGHDMR